MAVTVNCQNIVSYRGSLKKTHVSWRWLCFPGACCDPKCQVIVYLVAKVNGSH